MPVKLGSRHRAESEARIEIVPLIDIMFFLLAAFMLVSLSMVNMKTVKVNLPTATSASPESKRDFVSLSVDKTGAVYFDRNLIGPNELVQHLNNLHQTNDDLRVFISGDQDARHGDIVHVLDLVRSTGIQKVAFEIQESSIQP